MEATNLIEIISLFIGTGGLAGFIVALFTIRYERRKAKGEAHSSEYEGMKVEQDTYQELIADLREARNEDKEYISQLKQERRVLREERDELRKEIEVMRKELRDQGDKLARLGRIVEALKPLICANTVCKTRETDIMGLVSDDSFDAAPVSEKRKPSKKNL